MKFEYDNIMYYLKNTQSQKVEESVIVNGLKKKIKLFANETIYNIEADSIKLYSDSDLQYGEHKEKIIPPAMTEYFEHKNIQKLSEDLWYRKSTTVSSGYCKKVIIALGEMSLQGHNANLQYIYTPFNKFIEKQFEDSCVVISLIDCKNAVGDLYKVTNEEYKLLDELITSELEANKLSKEDLIFVGSSIGGTAAILLSKRYPASTVISSMPVLKCNQFSVDNLSRKQVYFITDNYEENIIDSIIPDNNYVIYCGSHDLTAHHNLHLDMINNNLHPNVSFKIVNDYHSTTRHFKQDILYQIDKEINEYNQSQLTVTTNGSKIDNNNLLNVNMSVDSTNVEQILNDLCPVFQLKIGNKLISYKGSCEEGLYSIGEGINLNEYTQDINLLDSNLSIEVCLQLIDIERKVSFKTEPLFVNSLLNNQSDLRLAKRGTISPVYYYRNKNLFGIEFELTQTDKILLSRLLITTQEDGEKYYVLTPNYMDDKVVLTCNRRRLLHTLEVISDLKLQLLYEDGSEQLLDVLIN